MKKGLYTPWKLQELNFRWDEKFAMDRVWYKFNFKLPFLHGVKPLLSESQEKKLYTPYFLHLSFDKSALFCLPRVYDTKWILFEQ